MISRMIPKSLFSVRHNYVKIIMFPQIDWFQINLTVACTNPRREIVYKIVRVDKAGEVCDNWKKNASWKETYFDIKFSAFEIKLILLFDLNSFLIVEEPSLEEIFHLCPVERNVRGTEINIRKIMYY